MGFTMSGLSKNEDVALKLLFEYEFSGKMMIMQKLIRASARVKCLISWRRRELGDQLTGKPQAHRKHSESAEVKPSKGDNPIDIGRMSRLDQI